VTRGNGRETTGAGSGEVGNTFAVLVGGYQVVFQAQGGPLHKKVNPIGRGFITGGPQTSKNRGVLESTNDNDVGHGGGLINRKSCHQRAFGGGHATVARRHEGPSPQNGFGKTVSLQAGFYGKKTGDKEKRTKRKR